MIGKTRSLRNRSTHGRLQGLGVRLLRSLAFIRSTAAHFRSFIVHFHYIDLDICQMSITTNRK
uniref:Uncharacterized protein n=1 Tax=Anguilla anguilla TaxID=7936 RepID=A0A0E9Q5W0_ANGAN